MTVLTLLESRGDREEFRVPGGLKSFRNKQKGFSDGATVYPYTKIIIVTDFTRTMTTVEVLGSTQDAGVPHIGCNCGTCSQARTNPEQQRYASSLQLTDDGDNYLFDATPDIRFQINDVPDGVFLSHAHLGHLPGLLYFGTGGVNANELPVYCTSGLANVIQENAPFRLLVDQDNIDLRIIDDGTQIDYSTATVQTRTVEHREALPTGTLSFRISGADKSLYYVSDIDTWTPTAITEVKQADIALVDGCFWSSAELDRIDDVPHPTIEQSLAVFADIDTEIYFTHLNHTNPILRLESPERDELLDDGFHVAKEGLTFNL